MKTKDNIFLEAFAISIRLDVGEIYDLAKSFFKNNLSPDEIYTIKQLEEWYMIHSRLKNNNVPMLSQSKNLDPEDIFDHEKLSEWAEENGFIKK